MVSDARPSSNGTTFSKPSAGVVSSNAAPAAPPSTATGASAFSRFA